jgi:F-box-like
MNAPPILLEHLPNEIVQRTFEWVKNSAPLSEFLPCLLVSKTWKQITEPVLWKNILLGNGDLESFVNAAVINRQGVYHTKNLSIALSMPFPLQCDCDHFDVGLRHLVREAGSGVFHDVFGGRREVEAADWGMSRELEPGEKANCAVDYQDIGTDDCLPEEEPGATIAEDNTEEDDETEVGETHCYRHPTMEPEKELLEYQLFKLSQLIKSKMRSIVTFSLVIDPECCQACESDWCGCYEPTLDSAVIDGLIAFLPSSCVNLELDTGGTEGEGEDTGTHICTTIQTLLPQLQYLRLRLSTLCAAAFSQHGTYEVARTLAPLTAPHLASMTINFVIFPRNLVVVPMTCLRIVAQQFQKQLERGLSDTKHFEMDLEMDQVEMDQVEMDQVEMAVSGHCHKLAQFLHEIYPTSFPSLKALNIFDSANTGFNDTLTDHLCPFGIIDTILHFDILKSVSHALPLHLMSSYGNCGRWFENYVVRNHKDEIILGSYAKIERYLEQSWANLVKEGGYPMTSLRFPIPFKPSTVAENPGMQWYQPTVGDDLCNEESYRNYVAEKDIQGLEVYRFSFANYDHHDCQDEIVEERHAKTVRGFVEDVKFMRED